MLRALASVFDAVERAINGATRGVGDALRGLARGPGQDLAFFLIIGVSGLRIVLTDLVSGFDRVVAWVEKALIAVILLSMVLLSFGDYLGREFPVFAGHFEGAPNLAMVGMVWVGFLGASLATRDGKHLTMDAADKLLSPGAAEFARRFAALVTAGLCYKLMGYAWVLTSEGLEFTDTLEGLVVWDGLVPVINGFAGLLPTVDSVVSWPRVLGGLLVAALAFGGADRLSLRGGPAARFGAPLVESVGAIAGALGMMALLPAFWSPTLEFGDPVVWHTVAPGDGFPLWLAQFILPASFGLMALRFLIAGIFGFFRKTSEIGSGPRGAVTGAEHPGGKRVSADVIFAGLAPGLLLGIGATLYFGKVGLILLTCLCLVFVGAPLFVIIGVGALASVVFIADLGGVSVATDMFEATKKQELLSIPFFVLAGNIMTEGSLSERLVNVARAFMGRIPAGLGLATVTACAIFAAISGSSPVTVIAVGSLLFPMLIRDRYPEDYSIGVLSSAGSLGIIIPPSIPMIVYAIMTSTPQKPLSPNDMFIAGVLPGLLIATLLGIYTLYRVRPGGAGDLVVLPELSEGYWANVVQALKKGILALFLPILVLGGIYGVLGPLRFTVTEAAAVSCVYALVVEMFIHRELTPSKLVKVLVDSGVMMGSLFVIIVLAIAFNKFLAFQEIPQHATVWLAEQVHSQLGFLLLVNIFLLILGCLMEILSAILIVAPLLAPMAAHFGIDPIHFGIIFIVNLEIGYLTPPMGINLFVASTVFNRPLGQVVRSVVPFIFVMLFSLFIISAVPALSTWLPSVVAEDGGAASSP